ncbi:MAG: DUF4861 domain-containing protein [Bacteroidetes bacterium]|nr:DUF4861 domain-containing protein [Bacteroidota bacterium]
MKPFHLTLVVLALLTLSCSQNTDVLFQVSNPSNQSWENATLLLTRGEISRWMEIPGETLPLLLDEKGVPLPCQADDVDGDGAWDELFAPVNLAPKEQKKVRLRLVSPAAYPDFETRTNLRTGDASKPGYPELESASRLEGVSYHNYANTTSSAFQMEGVAWENDRVGFRNYMDQRNGMDIFGKLTSKMVLDSVGTRNSDSYHSPADWGMDILKVGTSLGAGGIGYLYKDSIYRVGDNGSGSYQVVFEGSQRSRFNFTFSNWNVDGSATEVVQQIDISAGKHYYQSTVSYTGNDSDMDLVAGIVNMKSDELKVLKLGEHHTALLTHDLQAEDTTKLAMVLLVPNDYLLKHGTAPDSGEGIIQTYYSVLDAAPGNLVHYRFYALWEREDPRWASFEQVSEFLEEEAARWTQSVIVEVLN